MALSSARGPWTPGGSAVSPLIGRKAENGYPQTLLSACRWAARIFPPESTAQPRHIWHADRRLNYLLSVTCKIRRPSWKRAKDCLVPNRYLKNQIDSDFVPVSAHCIRRTNSPNQIFLDCCKLMGRKEPSPCRSTFLLHPVS